MGKTHKRRSFRKGGGLSPLSPGSKKSTTSSTRKNKKKEGSLLVKVLLRETQKMHRKSLSKPVRSSPVKRNFTVSVKQHARRKSN